MIIMVVFRFEVRKKRKDRDSIIDYEIPAIMSYHSFSNGIENADKLEISQVSRQLQSPQYLV